MTTEEQASAKPKPPEVESKRGAKHTDEASESSEASKAALTPLQLEQLATPLGVLLSVLVLLGIFLRVRDFGYPTQLQFDEHHFVETARGYLRHQPDWNDHPPLGKLLIAASMAVVGDTSVGFRIPSLIAGLLTIGIGSFAARRLFSTNTAAVLAAGLLSADGFLISYSRAALLDGFLVMGSLSALLLATVELSYLWGCIAGLVLGFAVSIKFSGVGVILPMAFALATANVDRRLKLNVAAVTVLVGFSAYVSTYSLGLSLTNKPAGVVDVLRDTERLLKHHAVLTDMKNPATSGWITWILPVRPLLLGITEKQGAVRALSTLGNLATWWGSVLLAVLAMLRILRVGWVSVLRGSSNDTSSVIDHFLEHHGRSAIAVLLAAVGFLAPWIMTHRDSYIYHFLPAYAPLVILLSGFLTWYEAKFPTRVLTFVAAVALVAAFYGPLWGYVPLSHEAFDLRLFLSSWK